MKYNIGDKVKVRSDLKIDHSYKMENSEYTDAVVIDMIHFAGKEVTISGVVRGDDRGHCYRIEEDDGDWNWTDGMFESQ